MILLSNLLSPNAKLLAYNFLDNSGLKDTGGKAGFNNSPSIFSRGLVPGIGLLISSFLSLLGIIFLVLIIYAGILWMTAEGDEAKIEKAKKILTQAIIGLIIVLGAYAISFFVISALSPK